MPSFYEFFAGGGMARAGLGEEWECLFANDNDAKKAAGYAAKDCIVRYLALGDSIAFYDLRMDVGPDSCTTAPPRRTRVMRMVSAP